MRGLRTLLTASFLFLPVLQGQSGPTATTTTLGAVNPSAAQFGQAVILTAKVSPNAATGTVAFVDGGVLLGIGKVNAGVAAITTLTMPAGFHSLQAVYSGDITYSPSGSTSVSYGVTALSGAGFASPATAGNGTFAMALGDFNNDGKVDVAVANADSSNTLSILLGNSNGTFTAASSSPSTGATPHGVAVGDFNGDGKADLVVANAQSTTVTILLGNGDGTFTAAANPPSPGTGQASVAVADFNGDGKADFVITTATSVQTFLGNGNGTFTAAASPAYGRGGWGIVVGDFNGDGKADAAFAINPNNNTDGLFAVILSGKGDGTFSLASIVGTGTDPYSLAVADFNGDGIADLAVVNLFGNTGGTVKILLGNGDGTFAPMPALIPGSLPLAIATADFNGDGKPDLAVTNSSDGTLSIFLGKGDGTFTTVTPLTAGGQPNFVAAGDFNGDGRADLLVSNTTNGRVSVLLATTPSATSINLTVTPKSSRFGQTVSLTAGVIPSNAPGSVEFLDGAKVLGAAPINVSGQAQILTALLSAGAHSLSARFPGVPGAWQPSQSNTVPALVNTVPGSTFITKSPLNASSTAYSLVEADFNGDGKLDLVASEATGNYFLAGNGDGTFQAGIAIAGGSTLLPCAAGDFNGDGKLDLAAVSPGSNSVSILLGNGDGSFTLSTSTGAGSMPVRVAVADLNGDGRADLVVSNQGVSSVTILLGNGDGTFTGAPTLSTPVVAGDLVIGDFNGDGSPDIAVALGTGSPGNQVGIFLGNGNGSFAPIALQTAGQGVAALAVGDFNGDGKADLASANADNTVSILLSKGDGTFTLKPAPFGGTPHSIAVADLNGDGKADLLLGSGTTVTPLLGNGDGTFTSQTAVLTGGTFAFVAVGDFNGDGRADLAAADIDHQAIDILLGAMAATLSSSPAGASITVSGTGCAPGSYQAPASLLWTAAGSCTVNFNDTTALSGHFFKSSTLNGTAVSGADPLLVPANRGSVAINAVYSSYTTHPLGNVRLSVSSASGVVIAGVPVAFTLAVIDNATNTVVTSLSDPIRFTSSDPAAVLPPDTTLINGVATVFATFLTAGSRTWTAVDIGVAGSLEATGSITVNAPSALGFVPVTPCRVLDTRKPNGAFGGPFIAGNTSRDFTIPNSSCSIPSSAQAYSLNVAVVPHSVLGFVTVWPAGQSRPKAATLNSVDGRIKSSAAIVPAGPGGVVSIYATNDTDVIVDINGYFVPNSTSGALAFYPVTPCRVVDTRNGILLTGPFAAAVSRTLPMQSSPCGIPSSAQAYSLNFVAVATGQVGFLTAWPTGQSRPAVATLNALPPTTPVVVANAAIVPAGTSGSIDVYATNPTDLVVDINGYFAPAATGGLSFYTLPPCRVLDTRSALGAGSAPYSGEWDVNVPAALCGGAPQAQAYVVNATVVPSGAFGFLSMWPQGTIQPKVATLNATDGVIANNLAIVPTSNTFVSSFATNPTQLILDIFGYFAP